MPSWFEQVFGFAEDDYESAQEKFNYDAVTGTLSVHGADGRSFSAGRFKTPSLDSLRTNIDLKQAAEALGNRPLLLRQQVGDVSDMHTLEENRYAVFQAASQFNSLEHVSEHGIPEHGITCYSSDRTQGPACATACAPGTVVRNYFAFGDKGQTGDRQVKNLEDVENMLSNSQEQFFGVVNGYTLAREENLQRLSKKLARDAKLCEGIKSSLRIGVQEDTEVVCSGFGRKLYEGRGREQLVTQAYCSAVSVSYSKCRTQLWEPFARLILEALYEATLYVAVENAMRHPDQAGARKVFLTAVGGGVFGNDMRWVEDAMRKSFKKFQDIGLEVVLVSHGSLTPEFTRLERSFARATTSPGGALQRARARLVLLGLFFASAWAWLRRAR